MCGIVGFIGKSEPAQFLIDKLKKLEYRGYDSAGIAWLENKEIKIKKSSGEISNLESKINKNQLINVGICHTRWATHGEPNVTNAHPHPSVHNKWAIVHNGIIENYNDIKQNLKFKSSIKSETDTAVIAQLLEESGVTSIKSFIDCLNKAEGSFAILALNKNLNSLFLAKNKSPLYVCQKGKDFLVASDPVCFVGFGDKYYTMEDNEFALISNGKIEFFNSLNEKIIKNNSPLEEIETDAINNFPHFMLKEIFETKPALKKLIRVYLSLQVTKIFETIANFHFESFCLVGCGTAYHAALMGAMMIEKIARIPCSSAIASEFIYSSPILSKKTLYIFVSQSGETADTIRALELVKSAGCQTLALTNVLYSTLSKLANFVLPVCAGREVSVASTKAYTCQISILYLLANYLYFGEKALIEAASKICNLSDIILDFDKKKIELLADQLMPLNEAIFIGKGLDYVTSLEASLKLKEISYINSSSYPSGELKHGFLALVTTKTPLIAINTQKNVSPKTINSASEAASRGANVFLVGISDNFNNYLALPALEDENLLPIVSIVPLQYLAYLVSIKRGINPDKPRNLAKSVTVE